VYRAAVRQEIARALAVAYLAGSWDVRTMLDRAVDTLDGAEPLWLAPVGAQVVRAFPRPPRAPDELAQAIHAALLRSKADSDEPPRIRHRYWLDPAMGRMRWPVPEIPSPGDLAAFLALEPGELLWLADPHRLERTASPTLRNYRYASVPRRSGLPRVLEQPKPRLKALQRRVLHEILDRIPPHDAAHGFTRGRSAATHAALHAGTATVLTFDLEDFFPSVGAGRVRGIFRTAGYPEPVARLLSALTTNSVPGEIRHAAAATPDASLVDAAFRLRIRLGEAHLPQGSPTSPALANLSAFRLDRRLHGLAGRFGATYSRYADDLVLSGDERLGRAAGALWARVIAIAAEEGFRLNLRKTRIATRARRQVVCGIVVNERPTVRRADYDRLRAILHNAARTGPGAQNRDGHPDFRAHLLGRIAWVAQLDPERGARLRAAFAQIAWSNDERQA
jgi:hypothetical protein